MPTDPPATGLTVPEVSRLLRVGQDRVRAWIRSGQLGAVSTASAACGRPRFVVLPEHLREWEQKHRVAAQPKSERRRRRTTQVDYYPD